MAGLSKVKGSGLATGAATASLVGIDDNATSTAITIDASEKVGIATTNPLVDLQIGDTSAIMSLGGTPTVNGTGRLKFINTNTQSNWQISHNDSASSTFQIAHSTATGGSTFSTPDLTIKNNGNVAVVAGNLVIGTSGKGIDFSATSDGSGTMTSEVLDDYEEGTWTPGIYGTGTAGNHTYAQQNGQYTKIGDEVHLQGYVQLSALGTLSGNVKLSGFPFTIKNVAGGYPAINIGFAQGLSITASMNLGGYGNLNATTCNIHLWDATTGTTDLTEGELSGDGGFIFTITYKVA